MKSKCCGADVKPYSYALSKRQYFTCLNCKELCDLAPALKSSEQILGRVQELKKEVEFVAKEEFALKATVRLLLLEELEQFIITGAKDEQE